MNTHEHLTEDQLVLVHYGEDAEGESHVRGCELCRDQLQALIRTLELVAAEPVPARTEEYGRWVWWRIKPELERIARPAWRRWAAVAAAAVVLMVGGFLAGRYSNAAKDSVAAANRVRGDRVLRAALNEHFERSGLVLVELANQQADGTVDLRGEQQRAENLIIANRLYRQAASGSGRRQTAELLEDLERILLEVAHSPAQLEPAEYEQIRRRIQEAGILFKVKFAEQQFRQEILEQ